MPKQFSENNPLTTGDHKVSVRIIAAIIFLVGAVLLFELASFVVVKFVVYPRDKASFFVPLTFNQTEFDQYLEKRDPELGWPSPSEFGKDRFDVAGARISPSFPEPGKECVTLFGDSYTYGDEVGHEEAWGNMLAESLNCRVGNYGVGGYGTDQALLRFISNDISSAKVAILGIFPHNILRNVNQYRYLITGGSVFGLKPRFVLKGEELERIPLPKLGYKELLEFHTRPADYLPYETFLPGSTNGPIPMGFPYSEVIIRYGMSDRVVNWLKGRPGWSDYVTAGHPSQSLEITAAIVRRFSETAATMRQQGVVLLYPTASSFKLYIEKGENVYQPLLDFFERHSIKYLDLHQSLQKSLQGASICEVLTREGSCTGHFNARGNKLVADAVYQWLQESDMLD